MRPCCIKGCDSSKYITLKYYAFFNFPLDDQVLLKKWLNQIKQPDLKPKYHQICSVHFTNNDIVWRPNGLPPSLKPTAVPTIFPSQKVTTVAAQSYAPTFLVTLPTDPSLKSSNGKINGNYKLPLIVFPSHVFFPSQASVPYAIPTHIGPQLNPQNHLQTQQFVQIDLQDSLLTQPVALQTQTLVQSDSKNPLQINPQNPEQPIPCLQRLKVLSPTLSAQNVPQMTVQNPAVVAQFPRIEEQTPENSTQVCNINETQNPMEISPDLHLNKKDAQVVNENLQGSVQISQISLTDNHNSGQVLKSPDLFIINGPSSGQLKNTDLGSYYSTQLPVCLNSPKEGQSSSVMSRNLENSVPKILGGIDDHSQSVIQVPSNSREPEGQKTCDSFDQKLSILQPILRKILPKQTFPLKTDFCEQEIHVRRVSKPDILIIPKNKNPDICKGSGRRKTPTLRISINKLCNVPSESKNSSEKENSSEEKNLSEKSITIENHATKKSVTFKLDSRTGEIVVENGDIIQSPNQNRSRNTGKKRKVDTSVGAPAANLRQLCARGQRECSAFRRKLKLLRQRHKRELGEIKKLQNLLSELDAVKESTRPVEVATVLRPESVKSTEENSRIVENSKKLLTQEKQKCDEKIEHQKISNVPLATNRDLTEKSKFFIPKRNSTREMIDKIDNCTSFL